MGIVPIAIVAVAAVALVAQPADAPRATAEHQVPSCVPTAPMLIRRDAPRSREPMPVTRASVVPVMPTTRLIPCYQADSLARAPRR